MAPAPHAWHARVQVEILTLLAPLARSSGLVTLGPFNLGNPTDFRVPDGGCLRDAPDAVWVPTALVVVEVESPGDETWDKLGFYASAGVEEVFVVSPTRRELVWLACSVGAPGSTAYERAEASRVLGPASRDLVGSVCWPAGGPAG